MGFLDILFGAAILNDLSKKRENLPDAFIL